METGKQGQVTGSAADIYEKFFVPALFSEWAPRVADRASITSGDQVLDVACGTGVLAREAARRVGTSGDVVGLDRNDWMVEAARTMAPGITWVLGKAEALPFPNDAFDAVVSQFGLMFFEDQTAALAEMWRVLRPGGRLAVAVWDSADHTPGYAAMIALLDRLFGEEAAAALRAPYSLGDPGKLRSLADRAGIPEPRIETMEGTARFPSIESWVYTDIRGWTLADMIDTAQYETLQREAQQHLAQFRQPDGTVVFAAPAHILSATR